MRPRARTSSVPRADARRGRGEQRAPKPWPPPPTRTIGRVERVRVVDVRGAGRREVALIREVRPLRELHAADELGDQEVEIRVAMAVAVRRHVHRHARDGRREVGAVIEVEAAQVVLVRLSLAAVLADDHARHGLEHFARAHDRPRVELPRRDRALARRLRDADEILRRGPRRPRGS